MKAHLFQNLGIVSLILTSAFVTFDFGTMNASAQVPPQGPWQPMQGSNHAGFGATPCFPYGGHGIHRLHPGLHGNQTYMTHRFGQNGTWVGNGTHYFGQYGNHTGFRMRPCNLQNSTSQNYGIPNPTINPSSATNSTLPNQIPNWVRNNAKWWSQNQVGDSDFVQGMQYLIQQGILKIPTTQVTSSSHSIPAWVKTNAAWWSQGQISDSDFVKGIQYLVSNGIVKVS